MLRLMFPHGYLLSKSTDGVGSGSHVAPLVTHSPPTPTKPVHEDTPPTPTPTVEPGLEHDSVALDKGGPSHEVDEVSNIRKGIETEHRVPEESEIKAIKSTVEHIREELGHKETVPTGVGLLVGKEFTDIENSLRTTWNKSGSSIQKLLDQATVKASQQLLGSENRDDLIARLKSTPPQQVKDEIAKAIGGLRAGKYGTESTYNDLSANKKALVDAIYKGMLKPPQGELVVPEGQRGAVNNPGVKTTLTRDCTVDGVAFKKGDPVVFVQKDGQTYVQQISKKQDRKDGDLDDVEVKPKLLKLDDLTLVKESKQKFIETDKPLFVGPVSTKDIKQGGIGDCYLIAGIYAIARNNPDAIHQMMKDNGDGTVTVRLFEKDENKELKPKYVTFDKSTLSTDEHAQDSTWVQMLEKAYATHIGSYEAIGHGGHTNDVFETLLGVESKSMPVDQHRNYVKDIVEKLPEFSVNPKAMEELTRRKDELGISDEQLETIRTMEPDKLGRFENQVKAGRWTGFTDANNELRKMIADRTNDPSLKDNPEFKEKMVDVQKRVKVENEKIKALSEVVQQLTNNTDRNPALTSMLEQCPSYDRIKGLAVQYKDDVEALVNELKEVGVRQPNITHDGKTFPAKELISYFESQVEGRFAKRPEQDEVSKTGVTVDYSQNQLTLFKDIQDQLKAGKHLALGTKTNIGTSQGKGHSGGESIVDGLAGQHAYALLDAVEMNGRKFVRVANPWGNEFSRDYKMDEEGQLVAKKFDKKDYSYLPESEHKAGAGIGVNESWIELKELGTLFNNIYVTQ